MTNLQKIALKSQIRTKNRENYVQRKGSDKMRGKSISVITKIP